MKRFMLILTKPPYGCEEPEKALEIVSRTIDNGSEAVVYLLGDAVEISKKSQRGMAGKKLSAVASKGGEIYASQDDMLARGLLPERVLDFVKPVKDIFDSIVDDLLDRADEVLSC